MAYVLVYRNGDPFFPGHRVVIHEKKVSNFEVFLKEVTGGVKAPFGAVRSIYTPRGGHRVHQLEELQSGEHYVAGGREFYLNTTTRYITFLYSSSLIANGDLINPAVRLFIPRKTLNQWDHVLEMVTEKVTLRSGAVHRLYTLDGKLVQSGSDLENGQFYVAVGRDKFKKLPYGDLLFTPAHLWLSIPAPASSVPTAAARQRARPSKMLPGCATRTSAEAHADVSTVIPAHMSCRIRVTCSSPSHVVRAYSLPFLQAIHSTARDLILIQR
uniref:Doublecortin domain containing 2 n=1 Tax=Chelonoidis abingdonii TaxID=106734 RepID=A0A8C0GZZ4_CHEAB